MTPILNLENLSTSYKKIVDEINGLNWRLKNVYNSISGSNLMENKIRSLRSELSVITANIFKAIKDKEFTEEEALEIIYQNPIL